MTKHKLLLSHTIGQFWLAGLDLVIFSPKEVDLSIFSTKNDFRRENATYRN